MFCLEKYFVVTAETQLLAQVELEKVEQNFSIIPVLQNIENYIVVILIQKEKCLLKILFLYKPGNFFQIIISLSGFQKKFIR